MLKFFVYLFLVASQLLLAHAFTNPIKQTDGSDPFMVYHEGYYCEFVAFHVHTTNDNKTGRFNIHDMVQCPTHPCDNDRGLEVRFSKDRLDRWHIFKMLQYVYVLLQLMWVGL